MAATAPAQPIQEVPRTLVEAPPPRLLGLFDQTALWANLGVSLLVLVSAGFVVEGMSLAAAFTAIVVGAIIGNALLGLAAVAGAETGAPSMVLLRGMFGRRGSWVPTALNIAQNIGWGVFEVIIISEAAAALTDDSLKPVFAIAAGAAATLMAIRPLGVVRGVLKKVAVWAVLASTAYLFVRILQEPLPDFGAGGWGGFWQGADLVIALPVSWMPLAADYSRHSRTGRDAFFGAFFGYGAAMLAFFSLGVLAYSAFALQQPGAEVDVLTSILAVPVGAIALLILVVDEVDEAFANIYSTVVSTQNVQPRLDRRVGAVAVGAVITALGLVLDTSDYENFLFLLGSVFLPLFGAFIVDYFLLRRRTWDTSDDAKPRWEMLLPWAAGFAVYHVVSPGLFDWWAEFWDFGQTMPGWASASVLSFATAAVGALVVGRLRKV